MSAGIVAATMSADKVSGIESYHPRAVKRVSAFLSRGGRRHAVHDAIQCFEPRRRTISQRSSGRHSDDTDCWKSEYRALPSRSCALGRTMNVFDRSATSAVARARQLLLNWMGRTGTVSESRRRGGSSCERKDRETSRISRGSGRSRANRRLINRGRIPVHRTGHLRRRPQTRSHSQPRGSLGSAVSELRIPWP